MRLPADFASWLPHEALSFLLEHYHFSVEKAYQRIYSRSDAEAVHDFRVGLRRIRSLLRSYGEVVRIVEPSQKFLGKGRVCDQRADAAQKEGGVSRKTPKGFRRTLKSLAKACDAARDTEVMIEQMRVLMRAMAPSDRERLLWVLSLFEERMEVHYQSLRAGLAGEAVFVGDGLRSLSSQFLTKKKHRGKEFRLVVQEIIAASVAELWGRLRKVRSLDDEAAAHSARIAAKRLRYLIEPLASSVDRGAEFVKSLKGLQDLLGEFNDLTLLKRELGTLAEAFRQGDLGSLAAGRQSAVGQPGAELSAEALLRLSSITALQRIIEKRRKRVFSSLAQRWLGGKNKQLFDLLKRIEL